MSELKCAYELAGERVISSKNKKEDKKPDGWDFIDIPEFSDREDKVVEISGYTDRKEKVGTNDTKFMDGINISEEDVSVKSEEPNTIHYGSDLIEACWTGHFMDYGGFARLNRTMVFGLSNRNVKMRVEASPYLNHVNETTRKQLEYFFNVELRTTSPKIFGSTVPLNMAHSGKKVLYTMIETSEHVHKDYAEKMNLTNEIWVATKYGKKIMENSNVQVPIYVMPLGVDTDRYKAGCGTMSFGSAMRQFKFLSVFRWSYRKGFDILLKSYLEEFSALDDVSLLLVSRALECPEDQGVERIIEDFQGIKSTVKKPEEEMPHIALYTKVIHEKNMPKVYNSCDAFALISRGEGFGLPYCFRKGTKISTKKYGYKNIENIKIGDVVITGTNSLQCVTDIHKNLYNGKFSSIKTHLMLDQLEVTSNHSFLAFKPERTKNGKIAGKFRDISIWSPSWIRAENLDKDCYLAYPKKKNFSINNRYINLEKSCKSKDLMVDIEKNKIWLKYSNRKKFGNKEIAKIANVSKRQVEHYKQDGKINSCDSLKVENFLKNIDVSEEKLCLPRLIEIDEKLAKLMGYYVAEGSVVSGGCAVEFSLHSKEDKYHREIVDSIKDIFGLSCLVKKQDNRCRIIVCSKILADMFSEYCGLGAENKYINDLILCSSRETIKSFLNGYINGDGHSDPTINTVSVYTVSEVLARQYQYIMMNLGEHCGLMVDNKGGFICQISGIKTRDYKKWIEIDRRIIKSKIVSKVLSNDNYIFVRIKLISRYETEDYVYNFDVPEDHSYISGIVVAHNCEAASTGLPVIASHCSGQSDFLNADNSYLVEPDGYIEATLSGRLSKMAKLCHFYEGQTFPNFGEDAVRQTREHMRYVYENRVEAKKKADKLRNLVVNNYTWDMAIDKVYDRLKEIQ